MLASATIIIKLSVKEDRSIVLLFYHLGVVKEKKWVKKIGDSEYIKLFCNRHYFWGVWL